MTTVIKKKKEYILFLTHFQKHNSNIAFYQIILKMLFYYQDISNNFRPGVYTDVYG